MWGTLFYSGDHTGVLYVSVRRACVGGRRCAVLYHCGDHTGVLYVSVRRACVAVDGAGYVVSLR